MSISPTINSVQAFGGPNGPAVPTVIPDGYSYAGTPGPIQVPGWNFVTNLVLSIVNCLIEQNTQWIQGNVNENLFGNVSWFISVAAPGSTGPGAVIDSAGNAVGSVYVSYSQNGPSAFVPPAPPPPLPSGMPALAQPPSVYTFPVPVLVNGQRTVKMTPNTAVFPCEAGQDTLQVTASDPNPTTVLISGVPNNGPWTYDGRYGFALPVILISGAFGKSCYVSASPVA
jgi:hypothetical protein